MVMVVMVMVDSDVGDADDDNAEDKVEDEKVEDGAVEKEEDDDVEKDNVETDPTTGTHTLCQPAQSKCTQRFHRSHFTQKCIEKMPRHGLSPERGHALFARACAVEMHFNMPQEPLHAENYIHEKCRALE